jgi:mannose-1-phosphate guanylyltransferase
MSRNAKPKQFLDILGLGRTFIQMTYDRFVKVVPAENILIVTSEQYSDLVREQLPDILPENILLEPYKRNTAPCIAYATYKLYDKNPDATVVVAPSDHLITGEENFCNTIVCALEHASGSKELFTIGIKPTRPDTNYGYIQINRNINQIICGHSSYEVKTFTEKPNEELAKVFIETGEFFWNSGIFIWNLQAIKEELEHHLPEVATLFAKGEGLYNTSREKDFIKKVYDNSPSISIDYGVMEKTSRAWIFLSNFGWSDVGTWSSLYDRTPNKTPEGNAVKASNALIRGVKNSIIWEKDPEKLIVVRGLEDFMVIDEQDVLLICPNDDKVVKDILAEIAIEEQSKYL